MDNFQLQKVINQIGVLKHRYLGAFPADLVPEILPRNRFCIVNTDNSNQAGTHWLLIANRNGVHYFGD